MAYHAGDNSNETLATKPEPLEIGKHLKCMPRLRCARSAERREQVDYVLKCEKRSLVVRYHRDSRKAISHCVKYGLHNLQIVKGEFKGGEKKPRHAADHAGANHLKSR